MLFDTRLTALGEAQAVALRAITEKLKPEPQLIVASPLRRALRTAELAFGLERYAATPRVTCVHARALPPRGAGVMPRRAALSTAASLRSSAVVVDGAPARRC